VSQTIAMIDETLAADVRAAALLKGKFHLRTGQVSTNYFDGRIRKKEARPKGKHGPHLSNGNPKAVG